MFSSIWLFLLHISGFWLPLMSDRVRREANALTCLALDVEGSLLGAHSYSNMHRAQHTAAKEIELYHSCLFSLLMTQNA